MILHKQIKQKHIEVLKDATLTIVECCSLDKDRNTIYKEKHILDNVMHQLLGCDHDIKCINESLKHIGSTELTLAEIGQVLGITRERVRQIEFSALRKLKNPNILRKLRAYMMM